MTDDFVKIKILSLSDLTIENLEYMHFNERFTVYKMITNGEGKSHVVHGNFTKEAIQKELLIRTLKEI